MQVQQTMSEVQTGLYDADPAKGGPKKGAVICTLIQAGSICFPCQVAQSAQAVEAGGCCYKKPVLILFAIIGVIGGVLQLVFRGGMSPPEDGKTAPNGVEIALNGVGGASSSSPGCASSS